jgi:hypothetical protein
VNAKLFAAALILILVGNVFGQSSSSKSNDSDAGRQKQIGGYISAGTAQPWNMVDEERIRQRTAMPPADVRMQQLSRRNHFSEGIDGRVHPELLFPYELYDFLLWGINPQKRLHDAAHRAIDPALPRFGYDPETFWSVLAVDAEPYITAGQVHLKNGTNSTMITTSTGQRFLVPIDRDVCRARYETLSKARESLGGQRFDRFLYLVVAPHVKTSTGGYGGDRAAQLHYLAGSCQ